jgi:hypothetical protein
MSRNGSGVYSLAAGNPVTTGTTISSSWANNTLSDIASALTGSIAADGQTVITANLPMSTYAHTAVGVATARTMYGSAGQVQDSTLTYLTTIAGTNTITAVAPVLMSAYATGQIFHFIAVGANTGAVTVNINAIGAKSLKRTDGSALVSGDIANGSAVQVLYDGTNFQLISDSNGFSETVSNLTVTGTLTAVDVTTTGNTILGNASTDTLNVGNGGLVKDASGNLGVGVTPSAWYSTFKSIEIGLGASISGRTADYRLYAGSNYYVDSGGNSIYKSTAPASRYLQASGQHSFESAGTGTAGNAITFTQAMTLDASGNLLVGATSATGYASRTLDIYNASSSGITVASSTGTSAISQAGTNMYIDINRSTTAGSLIFRNSSSLTTAMTLDASGALSITSVANPGYQLWAASNAAAKAVVGFRDTGTTYNSGIIYTAYENSSGTTAGSVQHTAITTVNFNTASDIRLKEDLGVATTSVIDNVIIHNFKWILDGRIDVGVFAQEAQPIKPSAISIGKDDLTEDGNIATPWSVDYSKFVPDLIVHAQQLKKQVQEQQALITNLTARLEVLEAK